MRRILIFFSRWHQLYALGLLLSLFASNWSTARTIDIAVISSMGFSDEPLQALFREEIVALLEGQDTIEFIDYVVPPNALPDDVNSVIEQAYSDPRGEVVLVLDIAANQVVGLRSDFPKPTFLPFVINAQFLGYPRDGDVSGKTNLSYLTRNTDFITEMQTLQSVAPFNQAVLVSDPRIIETVAPSVLEAAKSQAQQIGVKLSFLSISENPEAIISRLPPRTEAVLLGALPRFSNEEIEVLVNSLLEQKIYPFSLMGQKYVELGAFASIKTDTDWEQLARRNALNIEEVLLGGLAEDIPVFFNGVDRLVVNMETSRQLKYAPSFAILSDSILLNEDPEDEGPKYSLTEVARRAVEANLSLIAQRFSTDQRREDIDIALGALFPTISANFSSQTSADTAVTEAGQVAKSSTDAFLELTAPIFDESLWAEYDIQQFNYLSAQELLREIELDVIQTAVNSYLDVLRSKVSLDQERYNLAITRQNLELAQNRVDVGVSDRSDLFRWQSEIANSKQSVLLATAEYRQSRQELNRILNQPITQPFTTTVETLDNPSLIVGDKRVTNIISNIYALEAITNLFVSRGIQRSPELKQLEAQLSSDKRRLLSRQREYWVPTVSLFGEYDYLIDEDRAVGGIPGDEHDWLVGVEVSIPIFEGGSRFARVSQSRLAIRQTDAEYSDTMNTIETDIRNFSESVHASYSSIELAKEAEVASEQNYQLVAESYAQGTVTIIDLLDAQDTLIAAREASMNSVYDFLIDLMNLQRASGSFEFFLTDAERSIFTEKIINYLDSNTTTRN